MTLVLIPLCAHSSPCGPDTVVIVAAVSAAMTITAPGWRTVWGNAITPSSWPTWHCSWWFFCGAYTWHGRYHSTQGMEGAWAACTHRCVEPGLPGPS